MNHVILRSVCVGILLFCACVLFSFLPMHSTCTAIGPRRRRTVTKFSRGKITEFRSLIMLKFLAMPL